MYQIQGEKDLVQFFEHEQTDDTLFTHAFQTPQPDLKCWYDGYELPKDVPPVSLPISENAGKFKFEGRFCNWSCCQGYSDAKRDVHRDSRHQWIYFLAHKTTNLPRLIAVPDPLPRERLKAYGGDMTIEQFREYPNAMIQLKIKSLQRERSKYNERRIFIPASPSVTKSLERDLTLVNCAKEVEWSRWILHPKIIVQRGVVYEDSNIAQELFERIVIRADPNSIRFVVKTDSPHLSKISSLPSHEVLRSKMRLPAITPPNLLKGFDPEKEAPPDLSTLTTVNNKRRKGIFERQTFQVASPRGSIASSTTSSTKPGKRPKTQVKKEQEPQQSPQPQQQKQPENDRSEVQMQSSPTETVVVSLKDEDSISDQGHDKDTPKGEIVNSLRSDCQASCTTSLHIQTKSEQDVISTTSQPSCIVSDDTRVDSTLTTDNDEFVFYTDPDLFLTDTSTTTSALTPKKQSPESHPPLQPTSTGRKEIKVEPKRKNKEQKPNAKGNKDVTPKSNKKQSVPTQPPARPDTNSTFHTPNNDQKHPLPHPAHSHSHSYPYADDTYAHEDPRDHPMQAPPYSMGSSVGYHYSDHTTHPRSHPHTHSYSSHAFPSNSPPSPSRLHTSHYHPKSYSNARLHSPVYHHTYPNPNSHPIAHHPHRPHPHYSSSSHSMGHTHHWPHDYHRNNSHHTHHHPTMSSSSHGHGQHTFHVHETHPVDFAHPFSVPDNVPPIVHAHPSPKSEADSLDWQSRSSSVPIPMPVPAKAGRGRASKRGGRCKK